MPSLLAMKASINADLTAELPCFRKDCSLQKLFNLKVISFNSDISATDFVDDIFRQFTARGRGEVKTVWSRQSRVSGKRVSGSRVCISILQIRL